MNLTKLLNQWVLTKRNGPKIYDAVWAKDRNQVQCFPKRYWDLGTVQARLGFTAKEIDYAWAHKKPETVIYLGYRNDHYYFISNYTQNERN